MMRNDFPGILYFIGGVNGVGKSSLLDKVGATNPTFRVIHGSELLMGRLGVRLGDYTTLRSLPSNLKSTVWVEVIDWIIKTAHDHPCTLLDSHYIHIKNGVATPIIDDWITAFHGLFLITAEPSHVYGRIIKDRQENDKVRDIFPQDMNFLAQDKMINDIGRYLGIEHDTALVVAEKYKIPLYIIRNDDGRSYEACNKVETEICKLLNNKNKSNRHGKND